MLEPLLDRELEVRRLEEAWSSAQRGKAQLAIIWGRRRVGKTFLLAHFAAGKRAMFFAATQQAEAVELRRLHESIARDLGTTSVELIGGGFTNWEAALRFLAASAREEPLLVILDEVPYLARSTPGFASVVQSTWDHLTRGTRLMLVLTGSSVGTIESMLGAGGALRGRPTLSIRMDPIDLLGARAFLSGLPARQLMEAYAACGGYPLHLKSWDARVSTRTNLLRLAGTAGGILVEDAEGILNEELPDVGGYPRILAAIGRGRTRLSQIANEADQRIEHPLSILQRAGFVRRSVPVGAPRRARPLYELNDTYLAFWFTVLYADLAHVAGGQGRAVLARRKSEWERHLGWVFEEQARAHAARLVGAGELPKDLVVGKWWASTGPPCEIDILGLRGSRAALLGEARWQARPLGMRDLRALQQKAVRAPNPIDNPVYALWGRGGADDEVRRAGGLSFDAEAVASG
jgi:AAA+ ATPase superfamily predicted ATPase